MNQLILYYGLLSKRFLKKISLIVILCAIPLMALGLNSVAQQDSGILRIVLCAEDWESADAALVIHKLSQMDSVLQFDVTENEEQAREAVANNKADAAWIFSENYGEDIKTFAEQGCLEKPAVTIYEHEDTVALELARLKLYGAMFPELVYLSYCHFTREEIMGMEDLSDEALRDAYEKANVEGNLFRLDFQDGEKDEDLDSYITAPIRGMLSLMIFLCGLAAMMYFYQDEEQGMFQGISAGKAQGRAYVYAFAAMVPAAIASLITLGLLGQLNELSWECLIMALFLLTVCVACVLLERLIPSARVTGACIPFIMLGMFAFCPVFVSLRSFQRVQYFLPPYYYLNAVKNRNYVWGMMIYITVGAFINFFLKILRTRQVKL